MTKTWARRTVQAGALAAGFLLVTGGVAQAGTDVTSVGNNGIANGNQVVAPIQVPIDICGNAVAVAGVAGAGCDGGSSADLESSNGLGDMVSAGNQGILNGNQAQIPIQAPIDVCGNAVGALIGVAGAGCDGGSDASIGGHGHHGESKVLESGGDMVTAGNNGILNGNQLQAPIQIPINVCGNAIAVLGVAGAGCDGGSSANLESGGLGDMVTAGNHGIGNGNQLQAPIQIPINVCGNAIAVLGVAGAGCDGGADANIGGHGHHHGYAANESGAPELLPSGGLGDLAGSVPGADTVTGLAGGLPTAGLTDGLVSATNNGTVPAQAQDVMPPRESGVTENGGGLGDMVSAGNNGILNGNQLQLPIQIPIDISGNAIGILGVAGAGSGGGSAANLG
ncbi:chaplin family protein [Stackebrandtia soli]|uniref:chaplin family protein n=1 Tax=Stackebrandtia soli TaxID=1892856 RepID=UPI0039E9D416